MITILIISLIIYTNALEPQSETEQKIQTILRKYLDKVPDIENKYVVNERLSKSISTYFNGKLSALPLFKINLKIDRTPAKIPWTLGKPSELFSVDKEAKGGKITYKFLPSTGMTNKT